MGGAPPPIRSGKSKETPREWTGHAVVSLRPTFSEVSTGSVVTIVVEIAEAHDVASVPFHLLFDPTVLQWQGGQEGAFLSSDGHGTVFMIARAGTGHALSWATPAWAENRGRADKGFWYPRIHDCWAR